jgi:hypothetical protein
MTQETPGKVLTLLGVAMASMFFLFVVTFTNASLEGSVEVSFPNPFSPEKVVSVLDNAAAGYNKFIVANLTAPLAADFTNYKENLDWVIDQSDYAILDIAGLTELAEIDSPEQAPVVAGAYTEGENYGYTRQSGGLFEPLYSFLAN